MGSAATLTDTYIEPRTTPRPRRAWFLRYTNANFNAVSVTCAMPETLLSEGPYFTVEGFSFIFSGAIGTNAAGMQVRRGRDVALMSYEGWVTTSAIQAFDYRNLSLPCDWRNMGSTDNLLQFYILSGYAAADDFLEIVIWGYIDEFARDELVAQQPIPISLEGFKWPLKRST